MTTPESPAPQSAGLSAEEVARLVGELREVAKLMRASPGTSYHEVCERAATALEATAARLVEVERQRRIDEEYEEGVNERLRATLAERERELGEVEAARVALADEREEHIRTISDASGVLDEGQCVCDGGPARITVPGDS